MKRAEGIRVAHAVRDEIARAFQAIQKRRSPKAYFFSHLVRDDEVWKMRAKFGALIAQHSWRTRHAFADVRVGSYRYDQTQEGGLNDNSKDDESYDYVTLPFGSSVDGLRHGLWRLTDARYREAVEKYLSRKSHELTYLNRNAHLPSFEKQSPTVDLRWRNLPEVDVDHWGRYVENASKVAQEFPTIKDAYVEFQARHATRIYASTEGSLQLQRMSYWRVEVYLWLLSANGDAVPWTLTHFVTDPNELPDLRQLKREIRTAVDRMTQVAAAPPLHAYAGPVLLDPVPAGLLLHEAIGHRLEGDRLLSTGEGHTFRDSIGEAVLPEFLSMRDDPSLAKFEGQSLVGHYRFDDEGTPASSADLIDDGVLRGFLTSRQCVAKRHRSSGHARGRYHERPNSRMAVTIAEAKNGLDDAGMKAALLEEIRKQGVPYGIRILEANSGETTTDSYNFQAFLGETNFATKVYPDGREEVVRGVDFVGTPINAVRSIVAAGSRMEVDNAYCGAESGYVPVTTITPSLLVSHLELQAKSETPFTQYVYPIPWEPTAPTRRRKKRAKRARKA